MSEAQQCSHKCVCCSRHWRKHGCLGLSSGQLPTALQQLEALIFVNYSARLTSVSLSLSHSSCVAVAIGVSMGVLAFLVDTFLQQLNSFKYSAVKTVLRDKRV